MDLGFSSISDQDLLIILLNTGGILRDTISKYPRLKAASEQQLKNYRLIGKGVGVHWPDVDEDLSLKGFLSARLKNLIFNQHKVA